MTSAASSLTLARGLLASLSDRMKELPPGRTLAFLLAAAVCLTPAFWADGDRIVQTADYYNPLSPSRSISYIVSGWNPWVLGEASFRDVPLLFPYLAFWWGGETLGLSLPMIQKLWLVALFGFAFVSAWIFVRTVAPPEAVRHWGGPLVALSYVLNPFTVTSWSIGHQVAFLAYAAAPLWLAVFIRTLQRPPSTRSGLPLAAISLLFASAFNNPPIILAMIIVPTLLLGLLQVARRRVTLAQAVTRTGTAVPWLLLFHAWWLVPMLWGALSTGYTYGGASSNVLAWPNLANRVDFLEFIQGTGYWGFHVTFRGAQYSTVPSYLSSTIVVIATLWLASCALIPLLMRRRATTLALFGGILFVIGVFFAKATNPPLGEVNRWMYLNLPGFFIFRSAYEKFAGLVFLGVLTALVSVLSMATARLRNAVIAVTGASVLVAGWPLLAGSVVPSSSDAQIRADVRIPDYYSRLADWTESMDEAGSLLVVPQTPSGYVKTTWGYAGPDLIYNYSSMPVLAGIPEADPRDGPRYAAFLRAGRAYDEASYLNRVGVTHLLVRGDIDWRFYDGTPHPRTVEAAVMRAGFSAVASFGPFDVYSVPGSEGLVETSRSLLATAETSRRDWETLLVHSDDPLAEPNLDAASRPGYQTVCVSEPGDPSGGPTNCSLSEVASTEILFSRATVSGRITQDALNLTLTPAQELSGYSRAWGPLSFSVPVPTDAEALRIGNTVIPLDDAGIPRETVAVYRSTIAELLVAEGDSYIGDRLTRKAGEDPSSPISTTEGGALQLRSQGDTVTFALPIRSFDPGSSFRLRFGYDNIAGESPGVQIVDEEGGQLVLEEPRLPGGLGKQRYEVVFTPPPTAESFSVVLFSGAEPGGLAVNRFTDLELHPLSPAWSVNLGERLSSSSNVTLDMAEAPQSPAAVERENLIEDASFEVGLWSGAQTVGGPVPRVLEARSSTDAVHGTRSLELISSRGDGGVLTGIRDFDPDAIYRLSFWYKHVLGEPPAFGIWEHGTERFIARVASLSTEPGWHQYQATILPGAGSKGWSLFFYSLPGPEDTTINRYDKVSVTRTPFVERVLLFGPVHPTMDDAAVEVHRESTSSYEGEIHGLDGRTWLLLRQAFDSSWQLGVTGVGPGAAAQIIRHERADGFGNAWLIEGRGDLRFELVYSTPTPRLGGLAVTILAIAGLALLAVRQAVRRRGESVKVE